MPVWTSATTGVENTDAADCDGSSLSGADVSGLVNESMPNFLILDFSADTYATIIDKMIAGEPLKIYVKTLAGESTIFYTNNKDFKSKYNDIHDNFVKYNK